jgi:uncharacterized membrane protein (UPF0127 family)
MRSRVDTRIVAPRRRAASVAVLLVLSAFALIGCSHSEATVRIGAATTHPLVAATLVEQSRGLQGHSGSDIERGMLFVWDDEGIRRFALKAVDRPLDLIYLDADGTVLEVGSLAPNGPKEFTSAHPARYVLEIEAGWAEENRVKPGDRARINLGK